MLVCLKIASEEVYESANVKREKNKNKINRTSIKTSKSFENYNRRCSGEKNLQGKSKTTIYETNHERHE